MFVELSGSGVGVGVVGGVSKFPVCGMMLMEDPIFVINGTPDVMPQVMAPANRRIIPATKK